MVERLAYPLPIRMICELLGVPEADHDRWRAWAVGIVVQDLEEIARRHAWTLELLSP